MKNPARWAAQASLIAALAMALMSCTVLTATQPATAPATATPTPARPATLPAATSVMVTATVPSVSGAPTAEPTVPVVAITPLAAATGVAPTSEAPARPEVSEVLIYMVALNDNGATGQQIGCGDSLVPVRRTVEPTTDPVAVALNELFSVRGKDYGESGLYNALYQSNLTVGDVLYDSNGTPSVSINGQVMLGGTCDTPRFEQQITQTVLSAAGTQDARIFLNGKTLKEALSQK